MREVQHGQKSALRAPLEACFADGSCFVYAEGYVQNVLKRLWIRPALKEGKAFFLIKCFSYLIFFFLFLIIVAIVVWFWFCFQKNLGLFTPKAISSHASGP